MRRILAGGVAALALAAFGGSIAGADDKDKDKKEHETLDFSLGPTGAYIRMRDADRGSWFGGLRGQLRVLDFLGVEALAGVHQPKFASGDIAMLEVPVQVSALLFLIPPPFTGVYILGGGSYNFNDVDYRGALAPLGSEIQTLWGLHAGAGVVLPLGEHVSIVGDGRYNWMMNDPNFKYIPFRGTDFNFWMVTAGLNYHF
jgi:hypothetical protein